MKALRISSKFFAFFAALGLVLALNPIHSYADPYWVSPICTITADNMNPTVSSTITENFTVAFNSGLTSNTLHNWLLVPVFQTSTYNAHFTYNTQVLNSSDFPGGISPIGAESFLSNNQVAESSLTGSTYHISVSWGPGTVVDGNQLAVTFETNDSANEGCTLGSLITFHALSAGAISVNTNPAQVNTAVTASASFSDPDTSSTHTATWDWGDGNTTTGTVSENNGSGSVSNNHTYTATGVYTVTLTVTNNQGATATSTYQYISVYDSNTSFAGGHSFDNPSGANPNTTGKVSFGISSKYINNTLTGNVKMHFKAASTLRRKSTGSLNH